MILGTTGLQIIDPAKSDLSLLYDIGFATLMFTVGMHVPLHDRRIRGASAQGLTPSLRRSRWRCSVAMAPTSPAAVPESSTPS